MLMLGNNRRGDEPLRPERARAAASRAALAGACAALVLSAAAQARAATVERVSVGPGGAQANQYSVDPVISPDGRFVAFLSGATNLVAGDTNGAQDVFIRDRQAGVTERVSVGQGDVQGNNPSLAPAMAADGRYVAFESEATNLVAGDTNGLRDVFVRDRLRHRTELVSVGPGGAPANGEPLSAPAISLGGRWVAFDSRASNLVPGDTNHAGDVFLRDLATGLTERVSVGAGSAQADGSSYSAAITPDGRFVAFNSSAQNLVPGGTGDQPNIYVRDRVAGTTTLVPGTGTAGRPFISADGRILAFSRGNNVFVHDRRTGITTEVDLSPAGEPGNDLGYPTALAPGGRNVGFISYASNLVPGDTNNQSDAFVRDLATGRTVRVSVAAGGRQLRTQVPEMAISAEARFVAFTSGASNVVPGDTNRTSDVFVRAR